MGKLDGHGSGIEVDVHSLLLLFEARIVGRYASRVSGCLIIRDVLFFYEQLLLSQCQVAHAARRSKSVAGAVLIVKLI